MIDQYFTSKIAELRQQTTQWQETPADQRPGYFDNLNRQFIGLRDHIATYHHCVPAVLYGKYQASLQQYSDLYTEQRETAIPKKKF